MSDTLCPVSLFFNRFTLAELAAIMGNSTGAAIVVLILAHGGAVDVTAPDIVSYMGQAVSAGLLTSARSAQILNLSVSSP